MLLLSTDLLSEKFLIGSLLPLLACMNVFMTHLMLFLYGCMQDYTPFSCQKIISSAPGVGDHHGCPYRHFRLLL